MKEEKKTKEKEINLFTFIDQIQNKRRTEEYDNKVASAYMLSLWLSHDKELLKRINEINKYQFLLPDKVIYDYYMSEIPAGKRYLKWTKKRKEDDKLKKRIENLKENVPNISTRECKMIINFLMTKKK